MDEAQRVSAHAEQQLQLAGATLSREYYYGSLTLCVIDAIYSIGVRYEGVRAVVRRYCEYFDVTRFRGGHAIPPVEIQEPLGALCDRFSQLGSDRMSTEVFCNRQRTSTRSGILKSEAVWRFASTLRSHGIEYFQDIADAVPSEALEEAVSRIPGQASGISLQYFWMLAGSDDLIKPDRMILRFLREVLGRQVQVSEAQSILSRAAAGLREAYPALTPRLLDYKIWEHQRRLEDRRSRRVAGDAAAAQPRSA